MPLSEVPRLLMRVAPLSRESWLSYAHRMAQYNYPERPQIVQGLFREWCQTLKRRDSFHLPRQQASFDWLSHLMGLTPEQLHAMTLHRFAHIMTPPTLSHHDTLPLLTRSIPALLRNDQARYCPHCLSETAYHRLHWSHPLVTACSQHQSLLLDHCYHCRRSVSVWDVTQAICSVCGCHLSEGKGVDLSHDSLGLRAQQHLFTGLLDAREGLLPEDAVPFTAWEAYDLVVPLAQGTC